MDYRFIVRAEQNMPLAPHVAPYMSSNDNWEELLISNRLLLLRRSPRTHKPVALQIGPITKRTSCIGRHFDLSLWDQTRLMQNRCLGQRKKKPPTLDEAVTAAVLVESVTAVIREANVVTKAGTTKSGLPWTVAAETAGETDEKLTPEAAKLEAWASSWPVEDENEYEPGTPPARPPSASLRQN